VELLGLPYRETESIICRDEDETRKCALGFSLRLSPGSRMALTGDLGAGKTAFVRGIAEARGIKEGVHSPSYALVHTYPAATLLHHADLYRLKETDDGETGWEELGLEELTEQGGILLIEWPERLPQGWRFDFWLHMTVGFEPTGMEYRLLRFFVATP